MGVESPGEEGLPPPPRAAYLIPCVLGMLRLWSEATCFAQGAAAL